MLSRLTATKAGAATVGAVAIVGVLASGASAALPTFTVSVGSQTAGTATLAGTSNGTLTFHDKNTNLDATCGSATAAGKATLGTARPAGSLASIVSSAFNNCSANGQLPLTIKQASTWIFAATKPTSGGVTVGKLTKIKANVSSSATDCKFVTTGTVDAKYDNSNGVLSFAPASSTTKNLLKISNQTGNCLGLANNLDKVTFTGSYTVTSTSPSGTLSVQSN